MEPKGPPYQGPPIQGPPPPPPPYTGPNYQGFLFTLYSADNKPTHKLSIATQTVDYRFPYTISITGTWSNEDDTNPHPVAGVINGNGDAIDAGWPNGDSPPAGTCWWARLPIAALGNSVRYRLQLPCRAW
jgi:hypothetical protein